jgi:hypothetical protein
MEGTWAARYSANVSVNGSVIESVNASSTNSFTIPAPPTLQVSFELIRPTLSGMPRRTIADPMIGVFNTISNPTLSYSFAINNRIGSQYYFVPLVTNTSGAPLLMDVNGGLLAENRRLAFHQDYPYNYYPLKDEGYFTSGPATRTTGETVLRIASTVDSES